MPETARRRRPIDTGGPWGTGLLITGVLCVLHGLLFVFAPSNEIAPALQWVNATLPVHTPVWAALWVVAGGLSVVQALTPPQHHRDAGWAVGAMWLWAMLFVVYGCVVAVTSWQFEWRSWVAALLYGAFGFATWSWSRCRNPLPAETTRRRD